MEAAYFGFAFFIFALLCVFLLIARQVYKSVKKPDQFEREVNWAKRYQELQNMVDGFEAYVDEVQDDLRQEKAELRRLTQRVEETYRKLSGGEDIDAPVIVTLGNSRINEYKQHQRMATSRPGVFTDIAAEKEEAPYREDMFVPDAPEAPQSKSPAVWRTPETSYRPPKTSVMEDSAPDALYQPPKTPMAEDYSATDALYQPPKTPMAEDYSATDALYQPPKAPVTEDYSATDMAYQPPKAPMTEDDYSATDAVYQVPKAPIMEDSASDMAYQPLNAPMTEDDYSALDAAYQSAANLINAFSADVMQAEGLMPETPLSEDIPQEPAAPVFAFEEATVQQPEESIAEYAEENLPPPETVEDAVLPPEEAPAAEEKQPAAEKSKTKKRAKKASRAYPEPVTFTRQKEEEEEEENALRAVAGTYTYTAQEPSKSGPLEVPTGLKQRGSTPSGRVGSGMPEHSRKRRDSFASVADEVIWMHQMGFSIINIAQQLSITRSEVNMIIELWEKGQYGNSKE